MADEITAVWGILKDLTVLFENSVTTNLSGASALPELGGRRVPAEELDWGDYPERYITVTTGHWFMGDLALHVRWKSGGTLHGRGLFVQNASMTVSGEVAHGATVRVTGQWVDASHNGAANQPTAYLRGNVTVEMSTSVPFTTRHLDSFVIFCRGDGSGTVQQE